MSDVTIVLGGRERELRFNFNALADLDQACPGVVEGYTAGTQAGFGAVRGLLWAGLKHEERRLTLETVGSLLEAELIRGDLTLLDVLVKINDALIGSGLFKRKEASEGNATPEAGVTQASGDSLKT